MAKSQQKKDLQKTSRTAATTTAVASKDNVGANQTTVGIYDADPRMEGISRYAQVEIQPHLANAEKSKELGKHASLRHNVTMLKEAASNHKVDLDSKLWQWIKETESKMEG